MSLSIISTIAGLIILLAVLYSFIRPSPDAKTGFASLLTLIAFMLVAGPLWSSITVNFEFFKVTLTKEAESQMKSYVKFLNSYGRWQKPQTLACRKPPCNLKLVVSGSKKA